MIYYMDIFIFALFSIKTFALRGLETKENNAAAGVYSTKNERRVVCIVIKSDSIVISDQFRFLENCPPTPPLSQHFVLSEQ